MTNCIKLAIAGCFVVISAGCNTPRPLLAPPGPVRYQQNNASYHDPYADADLGPEVVGARPRDFQKPNAEPVRNRVYADSLYGP
ncbi:MAG: membrane or secreted protein [Planctomycetes bacterium]|nr:membrane or secreted protein [Planctomycetota bacterium]